jgi:hypothetical protein
MRTTPRYSLFFFSKNFRAVRRAERRSAKAERRSALQLRLWLCRAVLPAPPDPACGRPAVSFDNMGSSRRERIRDTRG